MKSIAKLALIMMVFALGTLVSVAQAMDSKQISPALAAQQQAATAYAAQLATVQTNRAEVIAAIVADWMPMAQQMGFNVTAWANEFQAALEAAPDAQLLAIQSATDYDTVRAILQGRAVPANVDGLTLQDLGDLSEDLTFTPLNPPCRILDTRNYGGGAIVVGGTTRSFYVHGSGSDMAAQGGNAAGCAAPKGEPVGAAINLAAVTPAAAGHLRMWPYGYTMPTVSYLNFSTGQNLANAGIISTAYLASKDISIYNGSTTHYLADVMGFFYPAQQVVPGLSGTAATTAMGTSCTNYENGSVTITVPGPGYVTVTAQAWIVLTGDGANPKNATIYLGNSASDCTFADYTQGYNAMNVAEPPFSDYKEVSLPVSRTFYISSAGTYSYYLNGTSNDGTALFWFASMQAQYSAN